MFETHLTSKRRTLFGVIIYICTKNLWYFEGFTKKERKKKKGAKEFLFSEKWNAFLKTGILKTLVKKKKKKQTNNRSRKILYGPKHDLNKKRIEHV